MYFRNSIIQAIISVISEYIIGHKLVMHRVWNAQRHRTDIYFRYMLQLRGYSLLTLHLN